VGEISYLEAGKRHYLAASGGFVEVLRNAVSILARTSEPAEEIDLERAERAREKAQQTLKVQEHAEQQLRKAEVHLKRAISRIQVHGRAHR
jgi:F-type H+-transporting ATPase subunit epsilon